MKIAFCTGIWKRHDIFKMFAKGVLALNKLAEIKVVVAGSEGQQSKEIVENFGFEYLEAPNEPLATKMNFPVQLAAKWNPDYFMMLGSDDILHPDLFSHYLEIAKTKAPDFIGVTDFYFYDTVSENASYWGGYRENYRKGCTCGAGRMISFNLMKKWNFEPFKVKHSKILDNSMDEYFRANKVNQHTFSLKETGLFGLDIKSDVNMTPFELWDNTIEIETSIIKQKFSYIL
jgi:hypothetical protein